MEVVQRRKKGGRRRHKKKRGEFMVRVKIETEAAEANEGKGDSIAELVLQQ